MITKKFAKEFEDKCARVDAHGFLRFLTEADADNVSLLDLIAEVEPVLKVKPVRAEAEMKLDEKEIGKFVNEFFEKYLPKKAEEVKQILNKTHPYFIDSYGNNHVNFEKVSKEDTRPCNVGHSGRQSFLDFNVYIHGNVGDLRTTAHELSHALSAHHQNLVELIRAGASEEEINKFTQRNFYNDCVGEIESHITERLFNKFLLRKGVYTANDVKNYENGEQKSLQFEINLIREERDIIKRLPKPVTYEGLKSLVKDLKDKHNDRLIGRIETMHDDGKNSPEMFRYVVGRIVADVWMKRFEDADKTEKAKMLNNFQKYLDRTHKLSIDSACEHLLNNNFAEVAEDYVLNKTHENKNQMAI